MAMQAGHCEPSALTDQAALNDELAVDGAGACSSRSSSSTSSSSHASRSHAASSSASIIHSSLVSPVSAPSQGLRTVASVILRDGLASLCGSTFDASALAALARETVRTEEQLAMGCYLVQAVAVVRCWHLAAFPGRHPRDHRKLVTAYVCAFYAQHTVSVSAAAAENEPIFVRTSSVSRDIRWRASFAVQVYTALERPEFRALEALLFRTSLRTLQSLERRFWREDRLDLMEQLLQVVAAQSAPPGRVEAALTGWHTGALDGKITDAIVLETVNEFRRRIEMAPGLLRARKRQLQQQKAVEASTGAAAAAAAFDQGTLLTLFSLPSLDSSSGQQSFRPSIEEERGSRRIPAGRNSESPLVSEYGSEAGEGRARDLEATAPIFMDDEEACENSALMGSNAADGPTAAAAAASALSSLLTRNPSAASTMVSSLPTDERGRVRADYDKATTDADIRRLRSLDAGAAQPIDDDDVGDSEEKDENEEQLEEAAGSAQADTKTSSRRKRKKRRHPNIVDAAVAPAEANDAVAASAAAAEIVPLASLPAMDGVPVQLIRLGVQAWMKCRNRQGQPMQPACDGAMADFLWNLADRVPEGVLLQIPELKQARRNSSREVAAKFSNGMAGERQCAILLKLLDHLGGPLQWC